MRGSLAEGRTGRTSLGLVRMRDSTSGRLRRTSSLGMCCPVMYYFSASMLSSACTHLPAKFRLYPILSRKSMDTPGLYEKNWLLSTTHDKVVKVELLLEPDGHSNATNSS